MAYLIIDIGNTALKAAWADGITLGRTFRYQGERMKKFILSLTEKQRPEIMVLSSVRRFTERDVHEFRNSCDKLLVMDEYIYDKYRLPLHLTPDRIASIIASRFLFKGKGCTIIDLGAMITADYIDSDGNYCGGFISPGCLTRFKSVNRYSRQYPLLNITESSDEKGLSLNSSIESGIISGIMFELEGRICQIPENMIVFTGGDANFFAKRMKNSIFVVCNLVLMGLALIALEYDRNN